MSRASTLAAAFAGVLAGATAIILVVGVPASVQAFAVALSALAAAAAVAAAILAGLERRRLSADHDEQLEAAALQRTRERSESTAARDEIASEVTRLQSDRESLEGVRDALTRALLLIRETAPILSDLGGAAIEKSRSGSTTLTDDIYAIGESSVSLSRTINSFLADLCEGDESLEHNVHELNGDIESLGRVAGLFDATNSSLESSVQAISESVAANVQLLGKVSDIAEQTSVLAINAAIYAAKAGDFGRGFSVIAGEIQKLARTAKEVAESVGTNTHGIEQQIEVFGAEQRKIMIESRGSLGGIIESIQHTVTDLRPQIERISGSVQAAADTSAEVSERLSDVNMTLQQHDAIQQIITHITEIIGDALDEAPTPNGTLGPEAEAIRERARQIAAKRFTMKDEFDAVGAHGYDVAAGDRAVLEDGTELDGDITLF